MILSRLVRPLAVSFVLVGGFALQTASAGSLADLCVASGGGVVDAKTCACIETKSAANSADQKALTQSFELNAKILKGGTIPTDAATSAVLAKGAELQGKYLQQCM